MRRRRRATASVERTEIEVFTSLISASDHPAFGHAPMDIRVYYLLISYVYAEGENVYSHFSPQEVRDYFQLTPDQLRPSIDVLKKQGWLKELNSRYILGSYDGETFAPLLEKPKMENPGIELSKYDWEFLIPFFSQLHEYCKGHGNSSAKFISVYTGLYPEVKALLDQKRPLTMALSSRIFLDTYYICYGVPHRDITREEGFVFTNLWKRYKDVGLVTAILLDYVMNFHRYRSKGVPTPKVLSFMADDIHAHVTGLNKNKETHEKKTRRSSRTRGKTEDEF